jgi:hypothetical protein
VRRRVAGGFVKEVGFYSTLSGTVAVRTPRCWHASISDDTLTFALLLDDLAPMVPGVQRDGCTVALAREALRNLAGLHAPRWNDPDLLAIDFLAPADQATAEFLGAIYTDFVAEFVARYTGELEPADVDTLVAVGPLLATWLLARPEPFTIVHGDYRLDNLMFPPEGDGVVALDWQTVSVAPPARDVAYFLGNSLDTELRRQHELELIQTYVDALHTHGVDYPVESCVADYRLGQLQGPMITVLGCIVASSAPTAASDEMFLTMARRCCAAIRDLSSLELVVLASNPR